MALAPSKLGRLIAQAWGSQETLVQRLRDNGLVKQSATDRQLTNTFRRAREEDDRLDDGLRMFNSPHERVRVFLHPYLTWKGRRWAVPLVSLEPPWWKIRDR